MYQKLLGENILLKRKVNEQKGLKSTISTFKIEELHEEILSLKSEVRVVTLEKDSMIDTLKQQLEKEVKSKNKLL